jgi:hypothetical protein
MSHITRLKPEPCGSEFIREGDVPAGKDALNVPASSRMNSLPQFTRALSNLQAKRHLQSFALARGKVRGTMARLSTEIF